MQHDKEVFIGRQPILDPRERIAAYELLFRDSAHATSARISDHVSAASHVIIHTFANIGVAEVLGKHHGFVNLTRDMLLSEVVEVLPKDRVVLEVLETVVPDEAIQARCRELKARGYTIALDDYEYKDPREVLIPWADYVKVDVLAVERRVLPWMVRKLLRSDVRLVAEKVEDLETFEACRKLGFHLYQGYYFARPSIVSGKVVDPARVAVLKLLQQLGSDVDIEEIADTFKHNADLGLNLLRLVNSAAMARRHKIATVRDAVAFLGRRQLRRWLTLLLFAGSDATGGSNPLLQTAAVRGRLMELLVHGADGPEPDTEQRDRAFLVGMLSLLDSLLNLPKDALVGELHLDDEIRDALMEGKGDLGDLLGIVEKLEVMDVAELPGMLRARGLDIDELRQAQFEAFSWVHDISEVST